MPTDVMQQPYLTTPYPIADDPRFSPIRPGEWEVVNEDLYDFQTYPLAGTTGLTFFAVPRGQGTKTTADTNMDLAGQISAGLLFNVRAIEIAFFPGVLPGRGQLNSAAVGGLDGFINDVWSVGIGGWMQMNILAKPYIQVAPLARMPFSGRLEGWGSQSDSTTPGAAQLTRTSYGSWGGMIFQITPVDLISNINFGVTLNWPTAVPLPSGVNGRIGVILRGTKRRVSQ